MAMGRIVAAGMPHTRWDAVTIRGMKLVRRYPVRGFTLIELLVVISLIALLVGVLLPVLASSRRAAKCTQCLSNMKQLGAGSYAYSNTYGGHLPVSPDLPGHIGALPVSPALPTNQLYAHNAVDPVGSRLTGIGLLLDGYLVDNASALCPDNSRGDLTDVSLEALRAGSADAYTTYLYRNAFAVGGARIDGLGQNPSGQDASVLLYDFNQTDLSAVGAGQDSLNHDGVIINTLHLDGHAASLRDRPERFHSSVISPTPFCDIETDFIALDAEG